MRHHFGDALQRDGGYSTIVPNRERYAYRIGDIAPGSSEITIVTIGRDDENWARVATLPNLEELTLHEPTAEQLRMLGELRGVRRLRITHARPKSLDMLRTMVGVEELVLEYVSGFSDLAPLAELPRLRAVHLENLRRVASFDGLSGIASLKYLAIDGTLDWQQPIEDFEFLRGLPALEVLALWQFRTRKPYPATLLILRLGNLRQLRLHRSYLATEEYALLEEGLGTVAGAQWGPYEVTQRSRIVVPDDDIRAHLPEEVLRANHHEVEISLGIRSILDPSSRWVEFTGRGAGRAKQGSATTEEKCRQFTARYEAMKRAARQLITAAPP